MYMGKNRRLANVKTRHETGLDYITQKLNIQTPFGQKELKELRPGHFVFSTKKEFEAYDKKMSELEESGN